MIDNCNLKNSLIMPCSQCGQVGHNITRCYNFMAAIDPDVLSTEYIPPLMRPMRITRPIKCKTVVRRQVAPPIEEYPDTDEPVILYHGTTIESGLKIQEEGFNLEHRAVSGRMLGNGVYLSPTLGKALLYAEGLRIPNKNGGVVLIVKAKLGKCLTLTRNDFHIKTQWGKIGYDSCYLQGGIWGKPGKDRMYDEYCIANTSSVEVIGVVFGNTLQATNSGYIQVDGRICRI